ncbi:MAG TPA: TfoX/Sxy family protein [Cytophagales bacterium]|nr:TfoX/Sxy family protein [Cytophagales bacterium]
MAYNENLTARIRLALAHLPDVEEKKMFGGIAFMVEGKMCLTARDDRMMCRIDPDLHEEVVRRDGCRTVIMKGREYKGYVFVNDDNLQSKADFNYWVSLALDFNKRAKASSKKRK